MTGTIETASPRREPDLLGQTVVLIGGSSGIGLEAARRARAEGAGIASAVSAVMPPFVAALALEIAPVRVNAIAPGFVDTPLSASVLEDQLDARRAELAAKLPIARVVTPADVAALAVHLMANTALTGATYDIDGGQQFVF